jgi:hypothetical protein
MVKTAKNSRLGVFWALVSVHGECVGLVKNMSQRRDDVEMSFGTSKTHVWGAAGVGFAMVENGPKRSPEGVR